MEEIYTLMTTMDQTYEDGNKHFDEGSIAAGFSSNFTLTIR